MEELEKKIIAYFDFIPMNVLASYLKITPKKVYEIYTELLDRKQKAIYKRAAKRDLDIELLATRFRRLASTQEATYRER